MAEASIVEIPRMDVEEAQRLLDVEENRVLNDQAREYERERQSARALSDAARVALEAHEKSHPGRVLFGGKAREAIWQETLKTLQVEHHNHQRAMRRLEQEQQDGKEYREFAASRQAAERLPQAAAVVATAKARDQAKELVGRWQTLSTAMNNLGVDSDTRDAQSTRTQLHQVLQQISRAPEAVKQAIDPSARTAVKTDLARTEKSIERAQTRDRGLGR